MAMRCTSAEGKLALRFSASSGLVAAVGEGLEPIRDVERRVAPFRPSAMQRLGILARRSRRAAGRRSARCRSGPAHPCRCHRAAGCRRADREVRVDFRRVMVVRGRGRVRQADQRQHAACQRKPALARLGRIAANAAKVPHPASRGRRRDDRAGGPRCGTGRRASANRTSSRDLASGRRSAGPERRCPCAP